MNEDSPPGIVLVFDDNLKRYEIVQSYNYCDTPIKRKENVRENRSKSCGGRTSFVTVVQPTGGTSNISGANT